MGVTGSQAGASKRAAQGREQSKVTVHERSAGQRRRGTKGWLVRPKNHSNISNRTKHFTQNAESGADSHLRIITDLKISHRIQVRRKQESFHNDSRHSFWKTISGKYPVYAQGWHRPGKRNWFIPGSGILGKNTRKTWKTCMNL